MSRACQRDIRMASEHYSPRGVVETLYSVLKIVLTPQTTTEEAKNVHRSDFTLCILLCWASQQSTRFLQQIPRIS